MTRQEHLDFCKARALEILETGDLQEAVTSMMCDIEKHPETKGHIGCQLGLTMMMSGLLSNSSEVRRFITGFN